MPPPQLPRVEELEFWSTGEKTRVKHSSHAHTQQDSVTISQELYDRVRLRVTSDLTEQLLHATTRASTAIEPPPARVKRANAGPFGLFGYFCC
jgi:hypothetical protein